MDERRFQELLDVMELANTRYEQVMLQWATSGRAARRVGRSIGELVGVGTEAAVLARLVADRTPLAAVA